MSTSEGKKENSPRVPDSDWLVSPEALTIPVELPEGLPDPQVVARMASEFFGEFPTAEQTARELLAQQPVNNQLAQPPATDVAALPTKLPASVPTEDDLALLTEEGLHALPRELSKTIGLAEFPTNPSLGSVPAIPGYPLSELPAPLVPFSFLENARPILNVSSPLTSTVAPTAANLPALPLGSLPAAPRSADFASYSDPAIAGAWRKPSFAEGAQAFQFLDANRALNPIRVEPVLEPLASQPAAFPNLGFSSEAFEVGTIRRDFPILEERVNGRRLVWLDNAATTQKPQPVIDRLSYFYTHENSNVHRAAHELAARSTDAYEAAREKTRRFLNAPSSREIIFVRGATEGINLVAKSWGVQNVQNDDEVVITWLEHHANIVPWQMLCALKGAHLRVAPVDNRGDILLDEYTKLIGPRTRLVAIPQVSNALGTVTPAREMIEIAHRYGATVLLDGAQAVSHMPVDVQQLDCDFYVFSGHKVFAPTGIGVVYGKPEVLAQTPPWQGGGNMIADVTFEKTIYQPPPGRFEAGTGNIADAVGLGAAIDYVEKIGMPSIALYEHDLVAYGLESLRRIPGLHLIGAPKEQAGVISFVLDGFRTEDIGAALNREGIAVRAGHHCAQPILRRFGLESTVRASLALYNTCEEIDALVAALWNLKQGRPSGLT